MFRPRDYKYSFIDVVIKWPGSLHDARVFANPTIKVFLRPCKKIILPGEDPVPILLLGGSTYPLISYLMKDTQIGFPQFRKSTLE